MRGRLIGAIGAFMAIGGLVAVWPVPAAEATDCQQACHERKSAAYESCRRIPPSERNSRLACFRRADQALARCLKSCR